MKAIFIIHETDPPEYFEEMEKIKRKVHNLRGGWTCERWFSEKFNKYVYEYRFWAEKGTLGDLVT